jgi:hypothetical protein
MEATPLFQALEQETLRMPTPVVLVEVAVEAPEVVAVADIRVAGAVHGTHRGLALTVAGALFTTFPALRA